jgi:DNA polymerase-3 subunit epsilon
MVSEWYSLIDPRDEFSGINVSIHGIDENTVKGAPTFSEVSGIFGSLIANEVVVTHTHFDRVAVHQAAQRWGVAAPVCQWLDSARVARRTWHECARSGYGLADVCNRIGYEFVHHNALEDAKAAGRILIAAMEFTGLGLEELRIRATKPIGLDGSTGSAVKRTGNAEGALLGEVVVFTGQLDITRAEAANLAAAIGCEVAESVTKKTTLLVVGDTDIRRLAGHEKSSKHRKAEELASQGKPIRIIRETDFRQLVSMA